MYEYRLFIIQKEILSIYHKKEQLLFDILKVLYFQKGNFEIGYSLYNQIAKPFAVTLLSNYISEKIPSTKLDNHTYRLLSFFEKTYITIRPTHIFIKTDQEVTEIFKIFHIYHRDIFVVDFKNNVYFWLDDYIRKHFYLKHI